MGALLRVVIRSGCPLFDRPKRDGKSRRAGRAAADGPAPRRGRESELARTSAMASLKHRFAKSPSAAQNRPRRRTAKGPGNESAGEGEKGRPAVRLSFCSTSKRASIGRRFLSATDSGFGGSGSSFAASVGWALYAGPVHASPSRPPFAVLSARCVESEPVGAAAVYTSRAVPGRGVSARSCSRRQNERSARARFSCRRRKYTGRRAYPRTIQANYTGRRGAEA
jgi:hypothetical protein